MGSSRLTSITCGVFLIIPSITRLESSHGGSLIRGISVLLFSLTFSSHISPVKISIFGSYAAAPSHFKEVLLAARRYRRAMGAVYAVFDE
jgi:hypothetical protein